MGDVLRFPQPSQSSTPSAQPAPRGVPGTRHPRSRPYPTPLWREAVGEVLRDVRHAQRRTLAEVAAAAGVSMQYLSEVERGRKEPSSEILGAVGEALGLRLVDLTARVTQQLAAISGPTCLAA